MSCIYSIRFWQLLALNTLGNMFATFFGYTCKTLGENKGDHEPISDELLTWANAFGAGIANGCARVLFGISCDYYTFRSVFIIAMSIQCVVAFISYQAVHTPWLYIGCILASNVCVGAAQAGIPMAVVNVFGMKYGVGVISLVNIGILFVSIINVLLTIYLMDIIGLELLFYVVALIQALVLVVLYFYRDELDVENLKQYDAVEIDDEGELKSDDQSINR